MMPDKHIVAFGGFRARPGIMPPLFDYALSLTGKARPRICYIPTVRDIRRFLLGQVVETPLEARLAAEFLPVADLVARRTSP